VSPTHEELARGVKVARLAAAADKAGLTADDVEHVNGDAEERESFWAKLAELADVIPPSETSRAMVADEMRRKIWSNGDQRPLTERARERVAEDRYRRQRREVRR